MKINKSLYTAALLAMIPGIASAQTTYNVATSFANNSLWSNNATWNPNTGTPGSIDSIDVTNGTLFSTGNAISLGGTSKQITNLTYSQASLGMSFNANTTSVANVNLQIDGTLTKNGASSLTFGNLALTGGGGISLNQGTLQFNSAATGAGTNQQSVTIAKDWTIGGSAAGDIPAINFRTTRSTAGEVYSGTLSGAINFSTTTPNRVLTVNTQNTATSTANISLNGNLTGGIGAKEVTFSQSNSGVNTTASVITIGGSGTTSFSASTNSKFVVGRLGATNNNINLDLVNGRTDGFGAVNIIQLGDSNVSPGASNSANIRVLSSVADTVEQTINVTGYTTAQSQAFTLGGTQTTGLATYSGAVTVSSGRNLTLLSNSAGATTAFTGGITANNSALNVSGAGRTAIDGTINGTSTLTVDSGATLTAGTNATNAGTLLLSGGQDLTYASGSNARFDVASTSSFDTITGIDALSYGGNATADFTFTLSGSASFDLLGFTSQSGTFDSLSLTGNYTALLNAGNSWTATDSGYSFGFDHSTGILAATAIPEPSTWALLASSLTVVLLLRRRA